MINYEKIDFLIFSPTIKKEMSASTSEWVNENKTKLELTERINKSALDKILRAWNTPYVSERILASKFENGYDPIEAHTKSRGMKTLYTKILKNTSSEGDLRVLYKQTGHVKIGRMFADIGLQGMTKAVRHAIAAEWYHDVDIKNCHPTLLSQYLENAHFNGGEILKSYVNDRDKIIEESGLEKDKFKITFLKILNGGGYSGDNELLKKFMVEASAIHDFVALTNKDIKPSKKDENELGSICNKLMCQLENRVLMYMYQWFTENGFEVGSLAFDGLMIRKGKELTEDVLKEVSQYVFKKTSEHAAYKCPLTISLVIKPMNMGIDTSQIDVNMDQPLATTQEFLSIEERIFDTELKLAVLYHEHYGKDNLKCVDTRGKKFYRWNEDTKLWDCFEDITCISLHIGATLDELCVSLMAHWKANRKPETDGLYMEKVEKLKGIMKRTMKFATCKNIAKGIVELNFPSNCKFEEVVDSHEYLLPVHDGKVIDIRTREVRDRVMTDYFSHTLTVTYEPGPTPKIDKFMLEIANNNEEERRALQILLGYSITGLNNEKIFQIYYGAGNNGKSTVTNMVSNVMGEYAKSIDHSVALDFGEKKRGDGPNSALYAVRKLHTGFINENDEESKMKSAQIKGLTSGGQDAISCREMYGTATTFIPRIKMLLLCNTKPTFDVCDTAMTSRIRFVPFKNSFATSPENARYVDEIRAERNQFFSYLINGAYEYCNTRKLPYTDLSKAEMEDSKDTGDTLQHFIDDNCVKDSEGFIQVTEMKDRYETATRLKITPAKLKAEMERKGFMGKAKKNQRVYVGLRFLTPAELKAKGAEDFDVLKAVSAHQ